MIIVTIQKKKSLDEIIKSLKITAVAQYVFAEKTQKDINDFKAERRLLLSIIPDEYEIAYDDFVELTEVVLAQMNDNRDEQIEKYEQDIKNTLTTWLEVQDKVVE